MRKDGGHKSPHPYPKLPLKAARVRQVSAQIEPLAAWDKDNSDPKVSSESSSLANYSNSFLRYIKPKVRDLWRKNVPKRDTERRSTKKQIGFHKVLSKQLVGQSQVCLDRRTSTFRSEDSRVGSSIVLVQKVKPTTNELSERMNNIQYLSGATSSLKSDVDQQAASLENFN